MTIVALPRGEGKTTAALQWLRQSKNRHLLVHSIAYAHLLQEAHADVADRIHPVQYVINYKERLPRKAEVGVDEVDLVLKLLLDSDVTFGTVTPSSIQPRLFE